MHYKKIIEMPKALINLNSSLTNESMFSLRTLKIVDSLDEWFIILFCSRYYFYYKNDKLLNIKIILFFCKNHENKAPQIFTFLWLIICFYDIIYSIVTIWNARHV